MVGEVVTAAVMNAHVRDNLVYLKGGAGAITFDSTATFSAPVTIGSYNAARGYPQPAFVVSGTWATTGSSSPQSTGVTFPVAMTTFQGIGIAQNGASSIDLGMSPGSGSSYTIYVLYAGGAASFSGYYVATGTL